MSRLTRLDELGVLHHVIIRGIEGKAIFRDRADPENLGVDEQLPAVWDIFATDSH